MFSETEIIQVYSYLIKGDCLLIGDFAMVLVKCPKCGGTGECYPANHIGMGCSVIGLMTGKDDKKICPLCKGACYVDDGSIVIHHER